MVDRRTFLASTITPFIASRAMDSTPVSSPKALLSNDPWDFRVSEFSFQELDSASLVFNREALVRVRTSDRDAVDEHGVPMSPRDDETLVNHPVTQSQYLLRMLSNFRLTQDEQYLQIAKVVGYRLFDTHHEINAAYYYPYPFDHRLVGDPTGMLESPWYSGMAQGQVLQSFTRLWQVTGDEHWLEWAQSTAESFLQINEGTHPGTMRNTASRDLWIEEYPDPSYFATLNGHIFGYLGLYEYWLITQDSNLGQIIDGAMTTVLNNVDAKFRMLGHSSRYTMNQDSFPDRYHVVHIAQLLETYRITHDQRFAEVAIRLYIDYPPFAVSGEIELEPGTYTVHPETRINPHLVLESNDTLEVGTPTRLSISWRRRLWNEEKFYYRFVDEDGTPWHIEESDSVKLTGEYTGPHHDHGPLYGTRMEFQPPIHINVNPELQNAAVSAIGLIDGDPHCLLVDTGEWVGFEAVID